MKLQSEFAILDVKRGRVKLERTIERGATVEVVVRGRIQRCWGGDDGVSKEFELLVDDVEVVSIETAAR